MQTSHMCAWQSPNIESIMQNTHQNSMDVFQQLFRHISFVALHSIDVARGQLRVETNPSPPPLLSTSQLRALNSRGRIHSAGVCCVNCMCRRVLLYHGVPRSATCTVSAALCYWVCYCNAAVCPQPQPPWQEVLMLTLPSPLNFTSQDPPGKS